MKDFQQSKILFKISGSFEIGLGHIRRSLSLTQELSRVVTSDYIFVSSGTDIRPLFQASAHSFNFRLNNNDDLVGWIKKEKIGVVIFDELGDNLEVSQKIKQVLPEVVIIGLDYFNYSNPSIDIIINLFNQNPNVNQPQDEFQGRYYEGLAYAILRESFAPFSKHKKIIRNTVEEILITFGGADHNNHTLKALMLLQANGYKGKVNVILGPFFQHKKDILEYCDTVGFQVSVHNNVNNMEKFIFETDLGFIGAGTTMMEFCHLGTPAVVMPQNEKEHKFAQFLNKQKGVYLLDSVHSSFVTELLFQKKEREKTSQIAQRLVDGKGKERIRDIILGSRLCLK